MISLGFRLRLIIIYCENLNSNCAFIVEDALDIVDVEDGEGDDCQDLRDGYPERTRLDSLLS